LTRYLLDTNIVSEALKPRPSAVIAEWLQSQDDADLFQSAVPAVIPQQPFLSVENGAGFITGIVIPFVQARANDRVGRMTLPMGDAIA